MSLPSWELLSYIVTVVALPFAIAVFLFEQRKERANEEEAIWQQISDAYIGFLELCWPTRTCACVGRTPRPTSATSSASACG